MAAKWFYISRVMEPASDTAKAQTDLIYFSFAIMVIVMITVFTLFAVFVHKYRDRGKDKERIPEQTAGNRKLEITWTVVPIILLAILAVPAVALTLEQSPGSAAVSRDGGKVIEVEVEAQQFQWTFIYENGKTVRDKLYLPAGYTAVFHLKSKDVIHSFWIPSLGGKVDAFPDRVNDYKIKGLREGEYLGKCAEFCGAGHTNMRFTAYVVKETEFQDWLKQ